jgi:hypothetical protein
LPQGLPKKIQFNLLLADQPLQLDLARRAARSAKARQPLRTATCPLPEPAFLTPLLQPKVDLRAPNIERRGYHAHRFAGLNTAHSLKLHC